MMELCKFLIEFFEFSVIVFEIVDLLNVIGVDLLELFSLFIGGEEFLLQLLDLVY